MIRAEGLYKAFGRVVAVKDVSFEAENGQITGLLGPNGAGKSTSMRMLYGLVKPDRGFASIDGVKVQDDPVGARRALGVLPDALGLYPRLTARENIRYFGKLHRMRGAALEKRIDALLDLLDMHAIAERRTDGFSQGERMKVAIARAMVHDPRNVLLDEPTNGLDVMSTRAMRELIRRLKDDGRCVVFSSHVMQEISALCDRIVVIADGRVVAAGSEAELLATAQRETLEDAFVALTGSTEGLV
ncbi:MAG: ATP-binding cassette domain-containing protein [Myxococcota bacterium]|nr:ATP-binding cassette domain-containing protein [Myxococcota bacterium]